MELFNLKKNKEQKGEARSKKSEFFSSLTSLVLLIIFVVLPIRVFVFQPFFVSGQSMEPNFHDGEYLIVNEFGYKGMVLAGNKELLAMKQFRDIKRGEVVVFRYPLNPSKFFIKRIVGLPGERVKIIDGKVKIFNRDYPEGFLLEESAYLPKTVDTRGQKDELMGENEFFVLGDNRSHSSDSRSWGKLEGKYLVGRVLFRGWPLPQMEIF